jgi:hypothetical protein
VYVLKSQYPQRTLQNGTWTYTPKARSPQPSATVAGSSPSAGAGSAIGRADGILRFSQERAQFTGDGNCVIIDCIM